MNSKQIIFSLVFFIIGILGIFTFAEINNETENNILFHIVDLKKHDLKFYWKNDRGENFKNIGVLKDWIEKRDEKLVFAMNGGMYNKDLSPQGLYVEKGKILAKLDTAKSEYGNFYMKPNGIFYVQSDYTPIICMTEDFSLDSNILYATQSGPLLLIDGEIHHRFNLGSSNIHIRNGVGILPNGNLLFAMSKNEINFYDFALYFKNNGCRYALYLDGFVSRTYLPSVGWEQLDGTLGVIIGQTIEYNDTNKVFSK